MKKDYYKVLGVTKEATATEIKKAYRKLAKRYHPDRVMSSSEAEIKIAKEKMQEINNAYDCLSNPTKKKNYDTFGSETNNFAGGGGGFQDFSGFGNMNDIFGSFFNQGGRDSHGRSQEYKPRGNNIKVKMEISLEEIFKKSSKNFSFKIYDKCNPCDGHGSKGNPITCSTCKGSGVTTSFGGAFSFQSSFIQTTCKSCHGLGETSKKCHHCYGEGRLMQNKEISVNIPYNVNNESSITLQNKGEYNKGGYGDLIIIFSIRDMKKWKKVGNKLITTTVVDLNNILENSSKQIKHLDDSILTFSLKKGIYPMEVVIPNKGLPLSYNCRGDVVIKIHVKI